ncbi:hypothetical protein BsIDN1_58980 [Bacillus safensis]|uniref:Uncharacterized protein n=1 Tax=Bacillus safensis TaxID=561879 RepID=A0A5S9MFL9_BACIA|nr:hypothetical protein BsIDN1_58980 [Bacillus safensis]
MGGLGSDAAVEAADIVIMTDQPSKVAEAIAVAKRTNKKNCMAEYCFFCSWG